MPASTNPFAKTRLDHSVETAEDYVEAILVLGGEDAMRPESRVRTADLSRVFGVAQPTTTKILQRLEADGLVCIHRRQSIHLTEAGMEMARRSHARHAMVVNFLTRIGVSQAQAELDAEGVEHHLSQESLDAIRTFLNSDTED